MGAVDERIFYIMRILLVSITHGLSFSVLVRRNDGKRYALPLIVMTVVIAVIGSFFVLISQNPVLHSSLSAVMMLFVLGSIFCWVSNAFSITERVFIYIMYVAVFMLLVGFSNFIAEIMVPADNVECVQLMIRTILTTVLIILLKLFLKEKLYNMLSGFAEHGVELTMFSILMGLIILSYVIFSAYFIDSPGIKLLMLMILSLILVFIFFIAVRIVQLTTNEIELEKMISRQRLLESELDAEKSFIENAKIVNHDLRHHDRIVLEYLEEGNIEAAKRYLEAHMESVYAEVIPSLCSDPLVDAQLRIIGRYCASHGVAFSADVNLPEKMGIDDIDFVSVVGNLMENAANAAVKCRDAFVSVSMRPCNGHLLLEIRNSYSGEIKWKNDTPVSAEKNGGTGLKSVKMILSRNKGMLHQGCEGKTFVSRVIIPLRI